jgi:hypothetical protein
MTAFEHFYIKDPKSGYNGWEHVYTHLTRLQNQIETIEVSQPASFRNRDAFAYVGEGADFLQKLCMQQTVRVNDFNPRLSVLSNMARSVMSMFEDERIEDMTAERCKEIKMALNDALEGALDIANTKKFILPVEREKSVAAEVLEDKSDPVLSVGDSYDNLQDAMRLMLRRLADNDAADLEKLLSPQERLFYAIREQLNKTISNFSLAAVKANAGRIQFARGTIAVQGRIDRKGLKLIPEHHVVQMAGTAMCPGFSSRDSDISPPTFFLHAQRFLVFNPDKLPSTDFRVSDTRSDRIRIIRERAMTIKATQGYCDVLENALHHKLFPGLAFVFLANSEAAEKLELRPTVKAELAF